MALLKYGNTEHKRLSIFAFMLENRNLEDSPLMQGKRKSLANTVRHKGIVDENVLRAIETLPRHFFIPGRGFEYQQAYEDKALQIGSGQTISQPYTVAYQTELLEIQPNDKVLEIGTGSGYQAAILAVMGADVYTIERHKPLHEETKLLLQYLELDNSIHLYYGDGFEGIPQEAPFDKILITAAAPEIPPKLLAQLKVDGIMVLPLGEGKTQQMVRITKTGNKDYRTEVFDDFAFVPMLKGKE
jgi:protein-L-isoaspartate(D-aspartate) O-methyltransferase